MQGPVTWQEGAGDDRLRLNLRLHLRLRRGRRKDGRSNCLGYGQRHAQARRIGHRKGAVDRSHGCRTVKTGQRIAGSANGQDRLLAVGSGGSRCRECAIKQPGFRPL